MTITNHGILDIVNLGFYIPVLPITAYIVFKQGFSRKLGWLYLTVLSILRIVGAITGLLAINNPTQGLIECSAITYGIGVTPLLLALLGILGRVNQSMSLPKISPRIIHVVSIPIMIGLIFAILGGLDEFNSDVSKQNTGVHDLKISTAIFAAMLGALTFISILLWVSISAVQHPERVLLTVAVISLPFFAVRVLYSVLTAYDRTSTYFKTNSNATESVIVQAAMSIAMEFAIVTLYILGGFKAMKVSAMLAHAQQQKEAASITSFNQEALQGGPVPRYSYPLPPANVVYPQQGTAYTGGYAGVSY